MAKPGDGMRTTYIPKDLNDYTYSPCTRPSQPISGAALGSVVTKSRNAGGNGQVDDPIKLFPQWDSSATIETDAELAKYFIGGTLPKPPPAKYSISTEPTKGGIGQFEFSRNADFICIYWKGLAVPAAGTSDLRIDIVRKFNGFP